MTSNDWTRLGLIMLPQMVVLAIMLTLSMRRRRAIRALVAEIRARPPKLVDAAAWYAANPTPLPLPHWWIRTRPDRRGIQLDGQGLPPCVEFYVPWWAWPFELLSFMVAHPPQ